MHAELREPKRPRREKREPRPSHSFIWNPYQSNGTGLRIECRPPGRERVDDDCEGRAGRTTLQKRDEASASAYFALTNTVSTSYWASAKRRCCAEEACSVELEMARPIIQTMHVYQEGRRRTSALPFTRTESVNFTTAKAEDDRDAFASCFQLQRLVGFGGDGSWCDASGDKGGTACELVKTNDNFMTLLHGVMNRDAYVGRLLARHQKDYYSNSLFPSIRRSFAWSPSSSPSSSKTARLDLDCATKVQLYRDSLAVNLQRCDVGGLTRRGPSILRDLLSEARLDADLNRLCVDAEHRRDRNLDDAEKREILFWYYSARWLSESSRRRQKTRENGRRGRRGERAFRFGRAMRRLIAGRLMERSDDYKRYAYTFKRQKRKNSEIFDVCGDPSDPVYECSHSGPFVAFVLRFLRARGYAEAAASIARASAEVMAAAAGDLKTDATDRDPTNGTERRRVLNGAGEKMRSARKEASLAREWWKSHVEGNACGLF